MTTLTFIALGILAGLFLPGALISRFFLKRVDLPAAFLLSNLLLAFVLTLSNIFGLGVSLAGVSCALAAVAVAAALGVWFSASTWAGGSCLAHAKTRLLRLAKVIAQSPLAVTCALGVVAIVAVFVVKGTRTTMQGYDVPIRWEYIASRAFEQGNFHFYPPISPADFSLYSLPDAMGLMVPGGYWWTYVLAGRADIFYALPVVVLQFLMVLLATWQCARALGAGVRAAALAVFLLATTGVVTTNVFIGQEVGFLVLSALVMLTLVFRMKRGREGALGACVVIGLACGAAALTREYGLAYLLVGLLGAWWAGASRGARLGLFVASAFCVGPWLSYVWVLTHNPFYTIGVLGLLPKNPAIYVSVMEGLGRANLAQWRERLMSQTALICLIQTIPALVGVACLARWKKGRFVLATFIVLVALLTVWGQFFSNGDLYYSYRMMAPAAAVLAIVCAIGFPVRWRRARWPVAVVALLTVHALLSIGVRYNYAAIPPSQWPGYWAQTGSGDHVYTSQVITRKFIQDNIARFEGKTLLSSDGYLQRALAGLPVKVIPAWSPGLEVLVDPSVDPVDVRRVLKAQQIDFIVVDQTLIWDMHWIVKSPWFKAEHAILYPRVQVSPDVEIMAIPAVN
jgi:hypothetical protein